MYVCWPLFIPNRDTIKRVSSSNTDMILILGWNAFVFVINNVRLDVPRQFCLCKLLMMAFALFTEINFESLGGSHWDVKLSCAHNS